jgi:hypothetical protein
LAACPSKTPCYKGSVATYDAVKYKHSVCSIPRHADELSANQDVSFSIGAHKSDKLKLTLDGIRKSVILMPLPGPSPTLVENSPTSFTISKCVDTTQNVSVLAVDADGNDIVGSGAPVSGLSSNDSAHLAVATPAPGSNAFELVPPQFLYSANVPNAGTVVVLTGTAKPLKQSGLSKPVSSHIDVTFNTDICGVISEYPVPTVSSSPLGIVAGPDGAMWFTEQNDNERIPA